MYLSFIVDWSGMTVVFLTYHIFGKKLGSIVFELRFDNQIGKIGLRYLTARALVSFL